MNFPLPPKVNLTTAVRAADFNKLIDFLGSIRPLGGRGIRVVQTPYGVSHELTDTITRGGGGGGGGAEAPVGFVGSVVAIMPVPTTGLLSKLKIVAGKVNGKFAIYEATAGTVTPTDYTLITLDDYAYFTSDNNNNGDATSWYSDWRYFKVTYDSALKKSTLGFATAASTDDNTIDLFRVRSRQWKIPAGGYDPFWHLEIEQLVTGDQFIITGGGGVGGTNFIVTCTQDPSPAATYKLTVSSGTASNNVAAPLVLNGASGARKVFVKVTYPVESGAPVGPNAAEIHLDTVTPPDTATTAYLLVAEVAAPVVNPAGGYFAPVVTQHVTQSQWVIRIRQSSTSFLYYWRVA